MYFIEESEQINENTRRVRGHLLGAPWDEENHFFRMHCCLLDGEVIPATVLYEGGTHFPVKFPDHWK